MDRKDLASQLGTSISEGKDAYVLRDRQNTVHKELGLESNEQERQGQKQEA